MVPRLEVEPGPVDGDEHPRPAEPPDDGRLPDPSGAGRHVDARLVLEHVLEALGLRPVDLLARDHVHLSRGLDGVAGRLRGRDRDLFEGDRRALAGPGRPGRLSRDGASTDGTEPSCRQHAAGEQELGEAELCDHARLLSPSTTACVTAAGYRIGGWHGSSGQRPLQGESEARACLRSGAGCVRVPWSARGRRPDGGPAVTDSADDTARASPSRTGRARRARARCGSRRS